MVALERPLPLLFFGLVSTWTATIRARPFLRPSPLPRGQTPPGPSARVFADELQPSGKKSGGIRGLSGTMAASLGTI
jgi:hypothetical protein